MDFFLYYYYDDGAKSLGYMYVRVRTIAHGRAVRIVHVRQYMYISTCTSYALVVFRRTRSYAYLVKTRARDC